MRTIKFRAWNPLRKEMMPWDFIKTIPLEEFCLPDSLTPTMQYVGLLDKNNSEIYEGDILKADTMEGYQYEHFLIVKYEEGNARYYPFYTTHRGFEVIGNIHENPELLNNK